MDDSNARFDKTLKEMTHHQDGITRMLCDFDRATNVESDKNE